MKQEKLLKNRDTGVDKTPTLCYNKIIKREEINKMTNYNEHHSIHLDTDRKYRWDYITANIGLGQPLIKVPYASRMSETELTDTGVFVIRSTRTGDIITMYLPTEKQVRYLYHIAGRQVVPVAIINKVRKNQRHYDKLKKIDEKVKKGD